LAEVLSRDELSTNLSKEALGGGSLPVSLDFLNDFRALPEAGYNKTDEEAGHPKEWTLETKQSRIICISRKVHDLAIQF